MRVGSFIFSYRNIVKIASGLIHVCSSFYLEALPGTKLTCKVKIKMLQKLIVSQIQKDTLYYKYPHDKNEHIDLSDITFI